MTDLRGQEDDRELRRWVQDVTDAWRMPALGIEQRPWSVRLGARAARTEPWARVPGIVAGLTALVLVGAVAGIAVLWAATSNPASQEAVNSPSVTASIACPVSSSARISEALGPALGTGPIYPVLGSNRISLDDFIRNDDGLYALKVIWVATDAYHGSASVTGKQVETGTPVAFRPSRPGERNVLDLPVLSTIRTPGLPEGWRLWTALTYVAGPGCYTWHIIGGAFATDVTIELIAPRTPAVSDSTPSDPPESVVGTARDELFELTIATDREAYEANELIDVSTTLRYIGEAPTTRIRSFGAGPVGFRIEQHDGLIDTGPAWRTNCREFVYRAGDSAHVPFAKSGAFNSEDPMARFWRAFFADPQLRLPPGQYRLSAIADYGTSGCGSGGSSKTLTASIDIVVNDVTD